MVTPTDEVSLAAGLAGVQAVLGEHGQRFDRLDVKLDHQDQKLDRMIERIDVVYPEIATLKAQVADHDRRINELSNLIKGIIGGVVILAAGLIGSLIQAGAFHW